MKVYTRVPAVGGSTTITVSGEVVDSGPYEYHEQSKHMKAEPWEYMPDPSEPYVEPVLWTSEQWLEHYKKHDIKRYEYEAKLVSHRSIEDYGK
jgi:hypothetical protein